MSKGLILLDKDGTLVTDVPFNVRLDRVVFTEGAAAATRRLVRAGYMLALVSNQAGVAHALFHEDELDPLWTHLGAQLGTAVPLRGVFYCPHHPEGVVAHYTRRCRCRKPRPGLIQRARQRLRMRGRRCWMVGDILDDIEAGRRAGCQTVLLVPGGETVWRSGRYRKPHFYASNLLQAATHILRNGR